MRPEEIHWPAPAKLNLMLRVTGRRPDGYHELQTVFQFLDHGDRIRFRLRRDGAVTCTPALPGVPAESNLAVRAARMLQEETGCRLGVELELDKRLPMGGGLGGGSSDAATVLLVLDRLWELGLSLERLAALGGRLGADVPVFVHGRAAWAEGRGDRFEPLSPPEPWYLVIHPGCQVSTAGIFAHRRLTRDAAPITIRDFLAGRIENTCEPLVRWLHPEVDRAIAWLDRHTRGRLTGTGSCVFGEFPDRAAALAALAGLPAGWQGFVARGCNLSPLHRQLHAFEDGVSPSG